MTDSLKAAAKAGDIKALEALMNQSFESKGVTVRVTNSETLLKIVVCGQDFPDKALLPTIKRGLAGIHPAGFDQVIVTAKAIGKTDAWSEQWKLTETTLAKPLSASAQPLPSSASKVLVSSENEKSTPLYQKSWLIIVMLMVFPLAALLLHG